MESDQPGDGASAQTVAVAPLNTGSNNKPAGMHANLWSDQSQFTMAVSALAYLCVTLFASVQFLVRSASESLSNDLFWVGFNASGGGVYVAQAFNLMLHRPGSDLVDLRLQDAVFLSDHDASNPTSVIEFGRISARMVQYHRLNTIEHGIMGLRRTRPWNAPYLFTQYCWVDNRAALEPYAH